MAEFNGKKFYGHSADNDPDLMTQAWNTKNFEFSCIRPEALQRAIDTVQSDVGASLKQKKSNLLSKLREKGGETRQYETFNTHDIDVETRVSQAHAEFNQMPVGNARKMNDGELGMASGLSSPECPLVGGLSSPFVGCYPPQVSPLKQNMQEQYAVGKQSPSFQRAVIEEYQHPTPKWVKVVEPKVGTMRMFEMRQQANESMPPHAQQCHYPQNMYHEMQFTGLPPPPRPHVLPAAGYAYDPQPMIGPYAYSDIYTDYNPRAYLVEDSDLEDELVNRQHYSQFCGQRPTPDDMQASDENDGCAEFINIAPKEPYTDMSYLKSTAPMRYSELSDDDAQEEYKDQSPKVFIKNRKDSKKTEADKPEPKLKKEKILSKVKQKTLAQIVAEEKIMSNPRQMVMKTTMKKPRKQLVSPTSVSTNRKTGNQSRSKQVEQIQQPNARLPDCIKGPLLTSTGKSIEQLKAEKVGIFNKMSRTHDRIIEALATLREKLLEVHEPESTSDRNRRNRNGFEFSVRFLRNFLYPLKGMIDIMRNTTREQFHSASSNDACNRVAHIYSLFLQAILTYSKQLRHFMIDQVPQKLTTLLEMLSSTTNICLDKRLFDRHDQLVDCLLNHCKEFLEFMEDLHAKRFVAARESYRKNTEVPPESKYNLKMLMNDLNMYEPKLVPKRSSSIRIRGTRKLGTNPTVLSNNNTNAQTFAHTIRHKRLKPAKTIQRQRLNGGKTALNMSDVNIPKALEPDVQTQVQNLQMHSSELDYRESREIVAGLQHLLLATPGISKHKKVEVINKAILDALKHAGQDQAFEVLKPLMNAINAALDLPGNTDDIENILNAFQMKISEKFNEQNISSQEKNEGHSLSHKAVRTKQRCHTSTKPTVDTNEQQMCDQQMDYSDKQQCHYDSQENDDDYDGDGDGGNSADEELINPSNCDYDEDEDEDEDAQFYISGEDQYSNKRSAYSTKGKLEPLIELVNEKEAAEIFESDEEFYPSINVTAHSKRQTKLVDMMLNPAKPSPYDTPCSQRSAKPQKKKSSSSIVKPIIPSTKKSAASAAAKSSRHNQTNHSNSVNGCFSKMKQTCSPPSPAMYRLKQKTQSAGTESGKKINFLKKHNRRNPLGSPPPVPTVSPSTSIPRTPSELHLSLDNTSISHKGVHTDENSSSIVTEKTSSFQKTSKYSQQQSIKENASEVGDTIRSNQLKFFENRMRRREKQLRTFSDGDISADVTQNSNIDPKSSPRTLYSNGNNPYNSSDNNDNQTTASKNLKFLSRRTKTTFDETNLLKERDSYLSLCIRSKLYTNPNFSKPWKMFARLSENLTEDVLKSVHTDFSSGVDVFVDDFLRFETRI